jgi:heme-degrading monooxygenase HmoA
LTERLGVGSNRGIEKEDRMTVYSSGHWRALEGHEDAFVEAWSEFARWLTTHEGAGTPRLARDMTDPAVFTSFADWTSAEAMRAWKSGPEFRERMARVREHTSEFKPDELELVVEVGTPSPA